MCTYLNLVGALYLNLMYTSVATREVWLIDARFYRSRSKISFILESTIITSKIFSFILIIMYRISSTANCNRDWYYLIFFTCGKVISNKRRAVSQQVVIFLNLPNSSCLSRLTVRLLLSNTNWLTVALQDLPNSCCLQESLVGCCFCLARAVKVATTQQKLYNGFC